MHNYMYIGLCMSVRACACMYVCLCACISIFLHVCMYVCMYHMCMYVCMHAFMNLCTYLIICIEPFESLHSITFIAIGRSYVGTIHEERDKQTERHRDRDRDRQRDR